MILFQSWFWSWFLLMSFLIFLAKVIYPFVLLQRKGAVVSKLLNLQKHHWLFGDLLWVKPTESVLLKVFAQTNKYPKLRMFWFGPFMSYLLFYHPHVLKTLLMSNEPKDDFTYPFLKPWIGDGLLLSKGKKWHRNRHLLTRLFHFDVLKEYVKVFNGCATILLEKWDKLPEGKPFEVFEHISLLTLDSMLKCSLSSDTGCQASGSTNKYASSVFTLTRVVLERIFNPLFHNDFIFSLSKSGREFKAAAAYIHQFDEQAIRERKSELKSMLSRTTNDREIHVNDIDDILEIRKEQGKWLDFLDVLLLTRDENGNGLTDREIRDELDTFLFEGHDTTASAISWSLYCLARHPKMQEKCRQELLDVLGSKSEIEWDDLSKFVYLTMFIKEVLRLYPAVVSIGRSNQKPMVLPRGFGGDQTCQNEQPEKPLQVFKSKLFIPNWELPLGWHVAVCVSTQIDSSTCSGTIPAFLNLSAEIMILHRNETLWEDPAVFDPNRFSKANSAGRSPFSYVPFSAGPRNCIGQNFAMHEIKIVLGKILQSYRLYVDGDCPVPEMVPRLTLKSANGVHVKVQKFA